MPVLGQDAGREAGREPVDDGHYRIAARHLERAPRAEVVLDVDHHQRRIFNPHGFSPPVLLRAPPRPRHRRRRPGSRDRANDRLRASRPAPGRPRSRPGRRCAPDSPPRPSPAGGGPARRAQACSISMRVPQKSFGWRNSTGLPCAPDAGLAVAEHPRAAGDEAVARRADVAHLVADVVRAAVRVAVEEAGDRRAVAEGLDELEPGVRELDEHGGHPRARRAGPARSPSAPQGVAIDGRRPREIRYRDRDVVEASDHVAPPAHATAGRWSGSGRRAPAPRERGAGAGAGVSPPCARAGNGAAPGASFPAIERNAGIARVRRGSRRPPARRRGRAGTNRSR